ncbi:MAG: tetratricopeptide repeat protein [Planctomycetes bacterium]|nr:tetratricopeptide repeat protein [Planctomycetota bacterium]
MTTLFLALEGLTGPVFRAALDRGALPAVHAVAARGTRADLEFPVADARLAMAVSAMTGTWPDDHEILLDVTADPITGALRETTAADRARPAVWERLDTAGIGSISVGWPVAITGHTKHAAIVAAGFGRAAASGEPSDAGPFVFPASLREVVADCVVRPENLGVASIEGLMPDWQAVDPAVDARPVFLGEAVAENFSRLTAFLALLADEDRGPWGCATLLLSLPGELASLERASEPMADGLLEGLTERGMELLNAILAAILAEIPVDTSIVIAGIPHSETPEQGGMLLVSGPAFDPESLPRSAGIPELAAMVCGACGLEPAGMVSARLTSLLRRDVVLRDPQAEWRPHPEHRALDTERLLAYDPVSLRLPDHALTQDDLWHLHAISILSRSLMARNEARAALPMLEAQARLLPYNQRSHLLLADCLHGLGKLDEALDAAYAAIHPNHGDDPVALLKAAELEALLGRPENARPLLDQAAPTIAAYPHHRRHYANALIFVRDWPAAERLFEVLAAETPADAWVLYRLARCHVARGNWQRGHDLAVASIRLDPSRALVHELLGIALHGLGLVAQAREALATAAAVDPSWDRPKRTLEALVEAMKTPQQEIEDLATSYWQLKAPPPRQPWTP